MRPRSAIGSRPLRGGLRPSAPAKLACAVHRLVICAVALFFRSAASPNRISGRRARWVGKMGYRKAFAAAAAAMAIAAGSDSELGAARSFTIPTECVDPVICASLCHSAVEQGPAESGFIALASWFAPRRYRLLAARRPNLARRVWRATSPDPTGRSKCRPPTCRCPRRSIRITSTRGPAPACSAPPSPGSSRASTRPISPPAGSM